MDSQGFTPKSNLIPVASLLDLLQRIWFQVAAEKSIIHWISGFRDQPKEPSPKDGHSSVHSSNGSSNVPSSETCASQLSTSSSELRVWDVTETGAPTASVSRLVQVSISLKQAANCLHRHHHYTHGCRHSASVVRVYMSCEASFTPRIRNQVTRTPSSLRQKRLLKPGSTPQPSPPPPPPPPPPPGPR